MVRLLILAKLISTRVALRLAPGMTFHRPGKIHAGLALSLRFSNGVMVQLCSLLRLLRDLRESEQVLIRLIALEQQSGRVAIGYGWRRPRTTYKTSGLEMCRFHEVGGVERELNGAYLFF